MNSRRYPAQVFWSDEDEGFIARAPDLPGCSAFGETQEEAIDELQSAIEAWVEAANAAGNLIPAPSSPASETAYSGKVLLRMPKSLHARLAEGAKSEGVSLNSHIVCLLASSSADPARRAVPQITLQAVAVEMPIGKWDVQRYSSVKTASSGDRSPWQEAVNG